MTMTMTSLIACGGEDRPAPSSDMGRSTLPATGPETASADTADCTAGAERECLHTFVSASGSTHCSPSIQFCKPSGQGWFECGEYSVGSNGELLPPK